MAGVKPSECPASHRLHGPVSFCSSEKRYAEHLAVATLHISPAMVHISFSSGRQQPEKGAAERMSLFPKEAKEIGSISLYPSFSASLPSESGCRVEIG